MSVKERLQLHRERILEIVARHGASRVRVFGSVVRGEDTEASDIDLLVDLAPDRSLLDHVALIVDLEDLLGRGVDVVNEKALRPELRQHVLSQAVSL